MLAGVTNAAVLSLAESCVVIGGASMCGGGGGWGATIVGAIIPSLAAAYARLTE